MIIAAKFICGLVLLCTVGVILLVLLDRKIDEILARRKGKEDKWTSENT